MKNGYAILELLFYIALFVIISIVVISSMITMARSFREVAIQMELTQGVAIAEFISREIRSANDITTINANDLVLKTKDSGGSNETVEFLFSGSDLEFLTNGVLTGNLNTPH